MIATDLTYLERSAQFRRCPQCDGRLRHLQTLLHSVGGKTVHECIDCAKLIWDD
jgi:uncharacterized protein with PIN domain